MQYYTETDCFWLDQICRWLGITIFVIFSLTFFGVCLAKTKLEPDSNFDQYNYEDFGGDFENFAEINFGYFFGFYTFITIMYVGIFYLFPYLVKN